MTSLIWLLVSCLPIISMFWLISYILIYNIFSNRLSSADISKASDFSFIISFYNYSIQASFDRFILHCFQQKRGKGVSWAGGKKGINHNNPAKKYFLPLMHHFLAIIIHPQGKYISIPPHSLFTLLLPIFLFVFQILLIEANEILSLCSMASRPKEENQNWQSRSQGPIYLDTAYKHLLRQQLKATALQNRTKVLNINQGHILKQVENNYSAIQRLKHVKTLQAQDSQMLSKEKQKKERMAEELKLANEHKRKSHERQMSCISLAKVEERDRIRLQAKKNRKENQVLIEQNRAQQQAKKRQVRNKIHDDIMESRSTIKGFFADKHEKIVTNTQEEIKRLNQRRMKGELLTLTKSGKEVNVMQEQMQEMRSILRESRVGFDLARQDSRSLKKKEPQEIHPLVRKIEMVMNAYTKLV